MDGSKVCVPLNQHRSCLGKNPRERLKQVILFMIYSRIVVYIGESNSLYLSGLNPAQLRGRAWI